MKTALLTVAGGVLAAALMLGQAPPQQTPEPEPQGQGRGGAPFAWGDKNKDGICDFTGRPVGQGRAMARGGGRGQMGMRGGRRGGRCGCCGMGMAQGFRGQGQTQPQPAPEAKKP